MTGVNDEVLSIGRALYPQVPAIVFNIHILLSFSYDFVGVVIDHKEIFNNNDPQLLFLLLSEDKKLTISALISRYDT